MLRRSPLALKQPSRGKKGRRRCRNRAAVSVTPMLQRLVGLSAGLILVVWSRLLVMCHCRAYLGQAHASAPLVHAVLYALRPQVLALERAQPPLVCQVAMPWSRPGVRAGEPVGALESRCPRAPPLTRKRIVIKKKEPAVPPAVSLRRSLEVSAREEYKLQPCLSVCHWSFRKKMKALRAW